MDGRTELEIPRVCVSLGCFPSLPLSLSLSVFVVVVACPRSHLAPLQKAVLDAGAGGELDGAPRHHLEDSWGAPPPEPEDALLLCNLRDHAGNCLAALAVCLEMGLDTELIRSGLAQFKGIGRRFDIKGISGGITVIDDYGHHPVEIKAALDAGRMYCGENKLIAVVQPHRYTRLRDLFADFCACFNEADHVIVADVYAAGETPLEHFEKEQLAGGLRA